MTEPIAPYQTPNAFGALLDLGGYEMFNPDLTRGVVSNWHDPNERNSEVDNDQRLLFLRDANGGYTKLTPSPAVTPSPFSSDPVFIGASEDLTRVFFESTQQLTPDAPPAGTSEVYEWANGAVSVVGVLPNGTVASEGATTATLRGNVNNFEHKQAVSPDGTDIVFQSGSPSQVYLRSDGATTTPVSLSQKPGSEGEPAAAGAKFLGGASADGRTFSKIYFTSSSELTDDAFTGPSQEGSDLYEFDVASGELRDLTVATGPQNPKGAEVVSEWFHASADGSYLYFFAGGVLAPGGHVNSGNDLYVIHGGETKYVASFTSYWRPYVSASGARLLIFTKAELTGEDTGSGINDEQAFIYDQSSGAIACASCTPGKTPSSAQPRGFITGYSHPTIHHPTNISADGSRAFFETTTVLDPRDTNGQADVYEWENGAVRLISSGRGAEGAHFLDASASGNDVFVVTGERLLPSDRDSNLDVYDSRAGGGLPLPPPAGAPCEGDACQAPPSAPNDATPASAGFSGPGNARERFAKPRKQRKAKKKKAKARQKQRGKQRKSKARHKQRGKQRLAKRKRGAKQRAHARHSTRRHG